jgi:hypothetical protein
LQTSGRDAIVGGQQNGGIGDGVFGQLLASNPAFTQPSCGIDMLKVRQMPQFARHTRPVDATIGVDIATPKSTKAVTQIAEKPTIHFSIYL